MIDKLYINSAIEQRPISTINNKIYSGHLFRHLMALLLQILPATSASKSSIRRFVITEKAPTRAFSWLKAATTAFTFKTLLRHYAKRALTPRSLKGGLVSIVFYSCPSLKIIVSWTQFHVERPWGQRPFSIVS